MKSISSDTIMPVEIAENNYYVYRDKQFIRVNGIPVKSILLPEFDLFACSIGNEYHIYEGRTGFKFPDSTGHTLEQSVDKLEKFIMAYYQRKINDNITKEIQRVGLSPRYRLKTKEGNAL